ncbi:non-ribosomal peptide synthetase module [Heliorestis acidaminivorans]|uniref:Non-ribosomal peptide synthetase module n=1 Tax=Heliorestis acidaminivorans TaxID=553427 RepID=A0A6I0F2M7_9FIRM|nr:DUF6063 family protein [Heliorestis acidaminivorans]KAB2953673.1 non-ribosomal peptide synthetase module [Heliorestis acidaminivorans]
MNYRSYSSQDVLQAFRLYARLAEDSVLSGEAIHSYIHNEEVQSLLEQFAQEVDCVVLRAGEELHLVPQSKVSSFHLKNESIRKYLGAQATNIDLYMMYFSILVFIGQFYNNFQSTAVQRDFLTTEAWLQQINERIETLRQQGEAELLRYGQEMQYNWLPIIEKWDAINDIKESALKQKGKTISHFSFLDKVLQFMIDEKIVKQIGEEEYELTEKSQVIVQKYFMDLDHNRNILKFMFQYDGKKTDPPEQEGATNAFNR